MNPLGLDYKKYYSKWRIGQTKALYSVIWPDLVRFCSILLFFFCIVFFLDVFQKDNRLSRIIPRCFWAVACITLLLNTTRGCNIGLDVWLKLTSYACFIGSGLKLILHWKAHLFIFAKSFIVEVLLSWIRENKNILSANSLAFEDNLSDKSLMVIKNNNWALGNTCFNIRPVRELLI